MNIREAHEKFATDEQCLQYIQEMREFTLLGLRNRDLQGLLYAAPAKIKLERRRRSAAITRKLRLLHAHGLIHKLPHTHRYRVSENGRLILNAILSAHRATIRQFMAPAA
jgi:coproporphyrinogen III oxidase-like Fe-S oxidoreductase